MASEKYLPGVWKNFWSWFKVFVKPGKDLTTGKVIFKGEDLNGNYYFETVDKFGRLMRFVEPKSLNSSKDLPMLPEINISPEWLRWLRKNRQDPPTEEELIRNAAIAYLKKQRAAELEREERKNWPQLDAKLRQIEEEKNYHPVSFFPYYRDLMTTPGQEYMINRGFYVPDLSEDSNLQLEQPQQQQQLLSSDNEQNLTNQLPSREDPVKSESSKSDRSQINAEPKTNQ